MEGLETAEESSSETSDDDQEEGPSTSGTSLHAADNGLDSAKPAARSPHRHPGTGTASMAFRSLEPLPAPGTGSGHAVSPALCAKSGQTSVEGCEDRTVATETEESREEEGGAEGKEPTEEGATESGLTQKPELEPKEAADGARATEATPGETGGSVPTAGLEGGPSGSTVSRLGVHVQSQGSLVASSSGSPYHENELFPISC